jgi:hypothetical protein
MFVSKYTAVLGLIASIHAADPVVVRSTAADKSTNTVLAKDSVTVKLAAFITAAGAG